MTLTAASLRAMLDSLPKIPAIRSSPYVPPGQAFVIKSSLVGGPVPRELESTVFVSEADYRRIFESKL